MGFEKLYCPQTMGFDQNFEPNVLLGKFFYELEDLSYKQTDVRTSHRKKVSDPNVDRSCDLQTHALMANVSHKRGTQNSFYVSSLS
ncbi:zinc finger E-box-binding homeobox 1-like X2 [Biomphalaria pfeifferi]|uniref:Zinc finger E-box-binding homeobox 1-like X2 n=1 Tax=Biomphalaria pfeifferi TaxID=112525 RepID=A0AAD8CD87_BIOPF|nr:zinc finger E-box-binding homeobox 1-like X2 [Biomphalaria pfeifferi]